jgi:protein-tyrosine sulfotransferase
MSNLKFNLWKKYWCPPLWLNRLLNRGINFSRLIFERYPLADKFDSLSCDPLFIISSGRSGTTLMRSMLAASGEIAIPAETQIIHILAAKFPILFGLGWKELSHAIIADFESTSNFSLWETNLAPAYKRTEEIPTKERSLARIIDEVFKTYTSEKFPEAKQWGDQSPIHTFSLPYIQKVFPKARYIHMLRDGRDVISSYMIKRNTNQSHDLNEAIYRWKTSIKRTKELKKSIPSNRYLEVRYEDLVRQPEEELRRVSQFLGIEYTSKMLDYWKMPTTIENKYYSFHANLGKPVFPSSIGKWKERLSEEQQVFILKNITPELKSLGYIG